jgi:hypothetical protein
MLPEAIAIVMAPTDKERYFFFSSLAFMNNDYYYALSKETPTIILFYSVLQSTWHISSV